MAVKSSRQELKNSRNGRVSNSRVKSPADDLVCPISLELPYYPVTAEDGRVYERSAILEHIDRNQSRGLLRSPVTNEKMGPRLTAAVQIKSLIETLVENGTIEGDLAKSWQEKEQQKKDLESLIRNATGGDGTSMHKVGKLYASGQKGKEKDINLAYQWFNKASDVGHVKGMAMAGYCLVMGAGVQKHTAHGISLISMAAEGGSDYACFNLGLWFANGAHGLPSTTTHQMAIRLLRKGFSDECIHHHANETFKADARAKLDELAGDPSSAGVPDTASVSSSDS
eukprot:CAMPEP_0198290878 /NCGR_PEP_ID=MMETSP1449-20131203/8585_1 /TAXON_ID=420275 /ORGANISM="Attheya septentrionalis, Strain CCMP2084" /LENGTH=282 /DNA_ID=CAMNT_0043989437 /DNA_START=31 /DNA_END=879 /DNA_ORIENTATION=+